VLEYTFQGQNAFYEELAIMAALLSIAPKHLGPLKIVVFGVELDDSRWVWHWYLWH
jgi:hypothetical protein